MSETTWERMLRAGRVLAAHVTHAPTIIRASAAARRDPEVRAALDELAAEAERLYADGTPMTEREFFARARQITGRPAE